MDCLAQVHIQLVWALQAKSLKQQFTGLLNAYAMFQSGNQTALDEALEAMKTAAEAASHPVVTSSQEGAEEATATATAAEEGAASS